MTGFKLRRLLLWIIIMLSCHWFYMSQYGKYMILRQTQHYFTSSYLSILLKVVPYNTTKSVRRFGWHIILCAIIIIIILWWWYTRIIIFDGLRFDAKHVQRRRHISSSLSLSLTLSLSLSRSRVFVFTGITISVARGAEYRIV